MLSDTAKAHIGKIEAQAANVENPFERAKIRSELASDINLRGLHTCDAAEVKKHYKEQEDRSAGECHTYLAKQLGTTRAALWGDAPTQH
jgi:hypothetical protein